jgi:hypothetical protein
MIEKKLVLLLLPFLLLLVWIESRAALGPLPAPVWESFHQETMTEEEGGEGGEPQLQGSSSV